jgi:hypothetical protein
VKHPVARIREPQAVKKKKQATLLARAFNTLFLRGKLLKIGLRGLGKRSSAEHITGKGSLPLPG